MQLLSIPDDYRGRILNIHPSLIPAFCGKGFHGRHVHEAVLAAGVKVSGCTVHFVDDEYDHGPIVAQRAVPVLEDDTPETLAERVFTQECEVYPEAVRLFAEGRLRIEGRRVRCNTVRSEERGVRRTGKSRRIVFCSSLPAPHSSLFSPARNPIATYT